MGYYIKNIKMEGNEHGKLSKDVIYAELYHSDGTLVIMATLEYILGEIRNRNLLNVDGVTVAYVYKRGKKCSVVSLKGAY